MTARFFSYHRTLCYSCIACGFGLIYNDTGMGAMRLVDRTPPLLLGLICAIDAWVFLVPFVFFIFSWRKPDAQSTRLLYYMSDFVAFAWPLIVLLVWQISNVPVVGLAGFK